MGLRDRAAPSLVEPGGFEPPTAWLQTRCSGRLSYDPGTASEESRPKAPAPRMLNSAMMHAS